MKARRFALVIGLAVALLGGAITVAYAFTSHGAEAPKSSGQKNDMVFNWGLSS